MASTDDWSDASSQCVSTQQYAQQWTGVEQLDTLYERVVKCLQEDGLRSPEALADMMRTILHRLEMASITTVNDPSSAEAQWHEVKPLSPRVWWRLTRPE